MQITQPQIQALLAPLAEQAHRADERAVIVSGRMYFGAGYISQLGETELVKYSDGSNTETRIAFSDIDRIIITDREGRELRAYDIVRDEPECLAPVRSTYGMVAA